MSPTDAKSPPDDDGRCGAMTPAGTPCRLRAGQGTDHVGYGQCKHHGGATPNGRTAAAREAGAKASVEIALMLGEDHVEPHEALLWCVRIAAAEVRFFTIKVSQLSDDDVVGRPRKQAASKNGVVDLLQQDTLHIWIRERHAAIGRLAQWSKLAIDAGVAERQVAVAERYGETISRLLEGVLADLKLTPAQQKQAPQVVSRHLALVTTGAA